MGNQIEILKIIFKEKTTPSRWWAIARGAEFFESKFDKCILIAQEMEYWRVLLFLVKEWNINCRERESLKKALKAVDVSLYAKGSDELKSVEALRKLMTVWLIMVWALIMSEPD